MTDEEKIIRVKTLEDFDLDSAGTVTRRWKSRRASPSNTASSPRTWAARKW